MLVEEFDVLLYKDVPNNWDKGLLDFTEIVLELIIFDDGVCLEIDV